MIHLRCVILTAERKLAILMPLTTDTECSIDSASSLLHEVIHNGSFRDYWTVLFAGTIDSSRTSSILNQAKSTRYLPTQQQPPCPRRVTLDLSSLPRPPSSAPNYHMRVLTAKLIPRGPQWQLWSIVNIRPAPTGPSSIRIRRRQYFSRMQRASSMKGECPDWETSLPKLCR